MQANQAGRISRRWSGFTLAELLAVVGIIAILVAVAIPVFAAAKERAKAGVCMANRRSLFGQLTYTKIADGLTQEQANKMRDEFGVICPDGGPITVTAGNKITVTCAIHGNTDGTGKNPTVVSQGLLLDFTGFTKDPQGAVSSIERYSNDALRKAFFASYGNQWPTLVVDGVEYQIEPYLASNGQSNQEIQDNTSQYLWLFARAKSNDGALVQSNWNVPFVFDPREGTWYEARNYSGSGRDSSTITFKDLDDLTGKLSDTHSNGKPKWQEVESWEEKK